MPGLRYQVRLFDGLAMICWLCDIGAARNQLSRNEWPDLMRVQVSEMIIAQAGAMAWDHGLRGYDAVQLAAAAAWQDAPGARVTLATFDRHL